MLLLTVDRTRYLAKYSVEELISSSTTVIISVIINTSPLLDGHIITTLAHINSLSQITLSSLRISKNIS